MAFFLIEACEIKMPEGAVPEHVSITSIAMDEKDEKKVSISGDVLLMNGFSIKLKGPQLYYSGEYGPFAEAIVDLKEECFAYIDGNRAQMQLFSEDDRGGNTA